MSQAMQVSGTVGQELQQSDAVRGAVAQIVAEVHKHASRLTDVRPPAEGLVEEYKAVMDRSAQTRGRGLLYPYVGSGLGNGALVELLDGSVKWDMITGIGVHFLGHSDPELIRCALEGAIGDTVKHGNLLTNAEPIEFSETLLELAGRNSRLKHCFLSTSGAMANENALKLCMQRHAPAPRVIAFEDCFMGRSIVMSQIGDAAGNRQGLPLSVMVDYMPYWNPVRAREMGKSKFIDGAVKQLVKYLDRYPNQHACFIFELVQGEGGFEPGDRDFFVALMDVCRDRGVAIWDDEIQTFGRTEQMFAYEHFDLGDYVDVFCVGKMTQACATLFTEEYNPKPGLLSGTFTGEGVSFRVGQRIMERLRDGDWYGKDGAFARHHKHFCDHVRALAKRHPEWFPAVEGVEDVCGGLGGMMRFTPFGGKKEHIPGLCKTLFEHGVIVFWCGHDPYHVRMLPPMPVFKEQDWPRVFEVVERGMQAYARTMK